MKKRFLSILLTLVMVIALMAGCSKNNDQSPATSSTNETATDNSSTNEVSPAATEAAAVTQAPLWDSKGNIGFDVPAKAGGGTDLISRFLTTGWDELIDGNFVVTNYDTPEVGAQHLKNAKPDGMTLSTAACTNMDNYLSGSSEVNPMEDYTVIAKIVAGGAQVVFTNVDAPYNNLQELKDYLLAHPGEVICGVALGGTSQLMWVNIARSMGDVKLNYVQCSSEADKLSNVAAGSVNLGNGSMNNGIQYADDGKIKILGLLSYSDEVGKDQIIPGKGDEFLTTAEQGFEGSSWAAGYYVVGPKGMDPALVEEINASIQEATKTSSFVDGMKQMTMVIETKGVAESQADFAAEYEMQKELTTIAGVNIRN